MTLARRVRGWISEHFWGAARLDAAGDAVYRRGGEGHLVTDAVVGGARTEFPVEDEILAPLIEDRRRQREAGQGESG